MRVKTPFNIVLVGALITDHGLPIDHFDLARVPFAGSSGGKITWKISIPGPRRKSLVPEDVPPPDLAVLRVEQVGAVAVDQCVMVEVPGPEPQYSAQSASLVRVRRQRVEVDFQDERQQFRSSRPRNSAPPIAALTEMLNGRGT